jgi:hypothetical protein
MGKFISKLLAIVKSIYIATASSRTLIHQLYGKRTHSSSIGKIELINDLYSNEFVE